MVTLVALVAIAVLALLAAGLLSAGEAAVLRVTRASLADALAAAERESGHQAAMRAERVRVAQSLVREPTTTVAAVSTLRVAAEVVAITALVLALTKVLAWWWEVLLVFAVLGLAAGLAMARVSPRQYGFRRPTRVLIALSGLLSGTRWLTGWAAGPGPIRDSEPSEEELRAIVDRVGESAAIEQEDRELIKSVFELSDTIAREVMVPRTEMVTVSSDASLRRALRLLLRSGYSRIPVIGASVDDMRGIAYLKDLAEMIDADPVAADRMVSSVARDAMFVPESKPVDDLLREMQAAQSHIALVVDEYGGIAGLITVEDILEELVGELVDEHDSVPVVEVECLGPGSFRVPARMPVDELGELFELRLDDDDVDTVGGLLAKALGKVPLAGSAADVGELHLVAERVQGRRRQVATVLVTRNGNPDPSVAGPNA